jgi:cytochrome P450
MYPEVQKRAQKEIDEVVGFGRLPDFKDRAQLVYVEALIMELLRWHQPAPLGTRLNILGWIGLLADT